MDKFPSKIFNAYVTAMHVKGTTVERVEGSRDTTSHGINGEDV
jgi:hypothetical protein